MITKTEPEYQRNESRCLSKSPSAFKTAVWMYTWQSVLLIKNLLTFAPCMPLSFPTSTSLSCSHRKKCYLILFVLHFQSVGLTPKYCIIVSHGETKDIRQFTVFHYVVSSELVGIKSGYTAILQKIVLKDHIKKPTVAKSLILRILYQN